MLYFVLIYVLFTVIFVFETAQAMLWVPEIRDDSPRRSMHDLFHSNRINLRYSKRRLIECYFVYNKKPRGHERSIVGHTGRKNGFAQIRSLQICSEFVKTEDYIWAKR